MSVYLTLNTRKVSRLKWYERMNPNTTEYNRMRGLCDKIAIFTANEASLQPMHDLIKKWCAVNTDEERYVIVGCEDVPGFEAVAAGEKVDVAKVEPGMVAKALQAGEGTTTFLLWFFLTLCVYVLTRTLRII